MTMWAVVKDNEILIAMKTREQARQMAKELGGVVYKCHVEIY